MSDIICVTNRLLCKDGFLTRIEMIAQCKPHSIILREKDLSAEDYRSLAENVMNICKKHSVPCILHSFSDIAAELHADGIHLPLHVLRSLSDSDKKRFNVIGCSCHSAEEAAEAERLGASYLIAGHVFATDCKKGLAPRGLEFLKNVCKNVNLPVYAIGGINSTNVESIRKAGAAGACIMSGFMKCDDIKKFALEFEYDV